MGDKPIIIVTDYIEFWKNKREELRKLCTGKERFKDFDLYSKLFRCESKGICSKRFNFTENGNKCVRCNELSLLSNTGFFEHENLPIVVENNSDFILRTKLYPVPQNTKVYFEDSSFDRMYNGTNDEFFKPREGRFKILRVPPNENERQIILGSMMSWITSIKPTFFGSYICDNLVMINKQTVKNIPDDINLKGMYSVLFSLICSSQDGFVHGRESLGYLYVNKFKTSETYKKLKIVHDYQVNVSTCDRSSLCIEGYNQYRIFVPSSLVSNDHVTLTVEAKMSRDEGHSSVHFMPIMDEFKNLLHYVIRMTPESFNYREVNSYNVFPEFTIYLWLIAFLCNYNLYEILTADKRLLLHFFFSDEIDTILETVREYHQYEGISYLTIKDICIALDFSMKIGIISNVKQYIAERLV